MIMVGYDDKYVENGRKYEMVNNVAFNYKADKRQKLAKYKWHRQA